MPYTLGATDEEFSVSPVKEILPVPAVMISAPLLNRIPRLSVSVVLEIEISPPLEVIEASILTRPPVIVTSLLTTIALLSVISAVLLALPIVRLVSVEPNVKYSYQI